MATSYRKDRDGNWGIRTSEKLSQSDEIKVTKKDGQVNTEIVDKRVWSGTNDEGEPVAYWTILQDGVRETPPRICPHCGLDTLKKAADNAPKQTEARPEAEIEQADESFEIPF